MESSCSKPEEIMPYVAVGTSYINTSFTKETFDAGFIWVTIFFGVVLLTLVGVTVYFAYIKTRLPPPPPPLVPTTQEPSIQSNIGGAVTAKGFHIGKKTFLPKDASSIGTKTRCEYMSNTSWENGECKCVAPFYGASCTREKHDKRYFAVGTPDGEALEISPLGVFVSAGKSFLPSSETLPAGSKLHGVKVENKPCSKLCDENKQCVGFIYDRIHQDGEVAPENSHGVCVLLGDDVVVKKDSRLAYSVDHDSNLHLKSSNSLCFQGKIFLGENSSSFPARYWLVKESRGYRLLETGEAAEIDFIPHHVKTCDASVGIYSLHPFCRKDVNFMMKKAHGTSYYFHRVGENLQVPISWKHREKFYVMYL